MRGPTKAQRDWADLATQYRDRGYNVVKAKAGSFLVTAQPWDFLPTPQGVCGWIQLRLYALDRVRDVDATVAEYQRMKVAAFSDTK